MIDVAQDHYLALLVCLRFRYYPCCLAILGWLSDTPGPIALLCRRARNAEYAATYKETKA
jgi:hypothetical protein